MRTARNRLARKNRTRAALSPERRAASRLRWAVALAAVAVMAGGVVSAHASTGGASSFTASAPDESEFSFSPMRSAGASWYGPGLYGDHTACGQTLRETTLGVAHKTLPCGTMVKFVYHGNVVIAPVIDRGPYVKGRAWDLTAAASEALGFEGVGQVRYAIATSLARQTP